MSKRVTEETTLTIPQAAERSGYCMTRLKQLLVSGELDGEKIGRNWVTSLEALKRAGKIKKGHKPPAGVDRRLARHGLER